MIVKDDIADVRSEPVAHALSYDHDQQEETQVLKNELVRVEKIRNGWAYVNCVQQMEFTHHNKWEGYPGWIQMSALQEAEGKRVIAREPAVKDGALRRRIVDEARKLIGSPYFWGGRSLYDPNNKTITTGVDCSGLMNLAYWNLGWTIPRDAHEQFLKATRIDAQMLKPGDLIFLSAPGHSEHISHVMMLATPTTIIEAPQTGERVREVPFDERLGMSISLVKNGDATPDGRFNLFRQLFPCEEIPMTATTTTTIGTFHLHHARDRQHHRRRNFYDAGRNRARPAVGRLGVGRVDHRWFSGAGRRAHLRGTRRHDARSRRQLCFLERSLRPAVGIFVRLGVFARDEPRNHRVACHRVRRIFGTANRQRHVQSFFHRDDFDFDGAQQPRRETRRYCDGRNHVV